MELKKIDIRHPVTQLFEVWFSDGVNLEEKKQLNDDLCDLVFEITQKFFGFESVNSLHKALDFALGMLSFGLMAKTSGKIDFSQWIDEIKNTGIFGLTQYAVSLIKEIPYPGSLESLKETKKPDYFNRENLKLICSSKNNKGLWNGYNIFLEITESINSELLQKKFAKWLIQNILSCSTKKFLLVNQASELFDNELISADMIINTILYRVSCGISLNSKILLTQSVFSEQRRKFGRNKSTWVKKSKSRYEEFRKKIPEIFYPALIFNGKDWFKRHLSDGPVSESEANYFSYLTSFD